MKKLLGLVLLLPIAYYALILYRQKQAEEAQRQAAIAQAEKEKQQALLKLLNDMNKPQQ